MLYALYDSMAIDMSLQFDLIPVTVKRDEQMYGHKNNSESLLEAYFKDQNLRKPPELDLHQLEERLIALRIPFMQIRELPRGSQYSLKGNVINVPVDIQPTVSCLPRPMDENFTIAVQLKKKLSYKKVDFKDNVRPLRVLTALHWLVNKSELYKKSGIVVDDNWFQEVTESAEDTVREFLEVSKQVNKKHKENSLLEQERLHYQKTAQ